MEEILKEMDSERRKVHYYGEVKDNEFLFFSVRLRR